MSSRNYVVGPGPLASEREIVVSRDPWPLRVALLHQPDSLMSAVLGSAGSWEQEVVAVTDVTISSDVGSARPASDAVSTWEADALVDLTVNRDVSLPILTSCLDLGVPVVTANAACVASHGPSLRKQARGSGTNLFMSGAVASRIPGVPSLMRRGGGSTLTRVEALLSPVAAAVLANRITQRDLVPAIGTLEHQVTAHLDGTYCAEAMATLVQWLWSVDLVLDQVDRIPTVAITRHGTQDETEWTQWVPAAVASLAGCARVEPMRVRESHALAGAVNPTLVTHDANGAVRTYERAANMVVRDVVESVLRDLAQVESASKARIEGAAQVSACVSDLHIRLRPHAAPNAYTEAQDKSVERD